MFGRRERRVPGLNLASMPDLIFTVLFFFMIVTHMRDVDLRVGYQVPAGSAVEQLTHKRTVVNIYIGRPLGQKDGPYVIQLNDRLTDVSGIEDYINAERRRMSAEEQELLTVSIKADRGVPMGLIADVKRALQRAQALKINLSATER